MYTLRPAGDADYDWLRRLHHATMRESVDVVWGWEDEWQDAYFLQHFDPAACLIVEVEGRDVGVLQVERRADEVFLSNIQIDPDEQGRGIGASIIRALQAEARDRDVPLILQVNRANRARTLYERLGFKVTGESETHFFMRWQWEDGS